MRYSLHLSLEMATLVIFTLFLVGVVFLSLLVYSSSTPYIYSCPLGECATNIYNGIKTCPKEGERVPLQEYQVCNPPHSCRGATPYAVLPRSVNGTITDPFGKCAEGEICPCSRTAYCDDYITTYFTVVGASPYENILDTSASVYQSSSYVNALDEIYPFSPLALPGETSFCSIPPRWLSRLYPKQCLRGSLYYLTPTLSSFDPTRDPLACIKAEPCIEGIPVLETSTRKIHCL